MHWLWLIPAVVAAVGLAVLAGLARRATEEAEGLRGSLSHLAELKPDVAELGDMTSQVAEGARRLGRRRT
jgi:hypothetical protein